VRGFQLAPNPHQVGAGVIFNLTVVVNSLADFVDQAGTRFNPLGHIGQARIGLSQASDRTLQITSGIQCLAYV
jgi:hypothetical protein